MTISFGSVSSSAVRISAPVHQPFIATSSASRLATAQKVRIHSRQLAAQTATRSPGPMPCRSRSAARERRDLLHQLVEADARAVAEDVAVAVAVASRAEQHVADRAGAVAEH